VITCPLTAGASDFAVVGAGDDTITAALTAGTNLQTWQATDVLRGDLGTDTLTATLNTNVTYAAATAANITGIEKLVLTSVTGGNTVLLGDATFAVAGLTDITNTLSTTALTVNGIGNLVGLNIVNQATAAATTFQFLDAVLAGTSDTVTLNVNGANGVVIVGTVTDADGDYETLAINTSGALSTFATGSTLGADATTLNIAGAGSLTIVDASFINVGTVNASTATGDVSLVIAADGVAGLTNTKTFNMGTGADTLNISAIDAATVGAVSVSMGAGNDTVTLGAQGAADFTIAGGDGLDTVSVSVAASAAIHSGISGFERLTDASAGVTHDMIQFTGNSTFTTIRAGGTGNSIFSNMGAGITALEIDTTSNATLTRLADTATNSLAISTRAARTLATLAIADEETVTINSARGALALTDFTTTDLVTLTVSGTAAVDVGTSSGAAVATVDVSGLNAAFTGIFSASIAAMTVTGNGTETAGALTITTGAGNDTINGGRGNDVIVAGGGNDVIRGGRGTDAITVGTGSDTLRFEATGAVNGLDTVTGFAGGTIVAGGDVMNFSAFLAGGTVQQNGGGTTVITAFVAADNNDIVIDNAVVVFNQAADLANAAAAVTAVVAEIQAAGNAFALTSGAKAVVVIGQPAAGTDEIYVVYVDDSLGATRGTIAADDMVVVMQTADNVTFDLAALTTANFSFIA
jgi:hypothetical protein